MTGPAFALAVLYGLIVGHNHRLPPQTAMEVAVAVNGAAARHELEPRFLLAVCTVESDLRPLTHTHHSRAGTNDYGICGVHCTQSKRQPPWLRPLQWQETTDCDALDASIGLNVEAAAHELAWYRDWHWTKCHDSSGHHWVSHYNGGFRITDKTRRYADAVLRRVTEWEGANAEPPSVKRRHTVGPLVLPSRNTKRPKRANAR